MPTKTLTLDLSDTLWTLLAQDGSTAGKTIPEQIEQILALHYTEIPKESYLPVVEQPIQVTPRVFGNPSEFTCTK